LGWDKQGFKFSWVIPAILGGLGGLDPQTRKQGPKLTKTEQIRQNTQFFLNFKLKWIKNIGTYTIIVQTKF
jgi:hypothetical protein